MRRVSAHGEYPHVLNQPDSISRYRKGSKPKFTRMRAPRLFMPTMGYSLPKTSWNATPKIAFIRLCPRVLGILPILTKRYSIPRESYPIFKAEFASDYISTAKCFAGWSMTTRMVCMSIISMITPWWRFPSRKGIKRSIASAKTYANSTTHWILATIMGINKARWHTQFRLRLRL